MKASKIISGSILSLMLTALSGFAQEFTLTTTKANIVSSRASIDALPGLTDNTLAIVNEVWTAMGGDSCGAVAIGTDVNGMERLPRVSPGLHSATFYDNTFQPAKTGNRTWDYTKEGVVHYGLMADFLRDVKQRNPLTYQNLINSAEHFARMWEKAEKQKASVK